MTNTNLIDLAMSTPMAVSKRLESLRVRMQTAELFALVLTNLSNVRYLTGFSGSAGTLVVTERDAVLVTDGRYGTQALQQIEASKAEIAVQVGATESFQMSAIADLLSHSSTLGEIGLEAEALSWARSKRIRAAIRSAEVKSPVRATQGMVEGLRVIKDEGELARMRAAAWIADNALEMLKADVLPSRPTESAAALALDMHMRRLGADRSAFETIVASGPRGAQPHARPTTRRINPGELVVIDFGAVVDGYCSDMTRTLCLGTPGDQELERMVSVVSSAQQMGVDMVRTGVAAKAVDSVCRDVISDAGFGEQFTHATGHGVGLDIHESPGVGQASTATLEEASVITVEPGVYVDGVGGVRIEDTVVVTAKGCTVLTCSPKDLVVTG